MNRANPYSVNNSRNAINPPQPYTGAADMRPGHSACATVTVFHKASSALIFVLPTTAHAHRFLPAGKEFASFLLGDLGFENSPSRAVNGTKFIQIMPDTYGKAGSNRGSKCSGFSHRGTVYWYRNEICLNLTTLFLLTPYRGGIMNDYLPA